MRSTTTLVICLVVAVAAGICNDDDNDNDNERLRNESSVDGSTSLLYNLSTKQRRHVKKELLHLLGLNHIPKPSTRRQRLEGSRASAPTYMLSLYETIQRHDEDEDDDDVVPMVDRTGRSDDSISVSRLVNKQLGSADTVMSFVNQAFSDHENGMNRFAIDCRFDLSSQVSSSDVLTGAVLRIYKSSKVKGSTEKIRIEIHRPKTRNDSLLDRVPKPQTLEQRVTLLSSRSGWIDINLTRMTSQWMTSPKRNEGLRIHVFNRRGELVDPSSVGLVGSNGSPDKQVFLVAFFKNNPDQTTTTTTTTATRRKRSADNNNNNNNKRTTRQHDSTPQNDDHQIWYRTNKQERKCQIRTLKVSFKDLKWQDWIIAPEGYAAYYCDGDCVSLLDAHNATNHAIVQTMAYMMNPSSVPKPCCAPTKLSALSVLYFDDNSNVILKKYRNMVVRACGCH